MSYRSRCNRRHNTREQKKLRRIIRALRDAPIVGGSIGKVVGFNWAISPSHRAFVMDRLGERYGVRISP